MSDGLSDGSSDNESADDEIEWFYSEVTPEGQAEAAEEFRRMFGDNPENPVPVVTFLDRFIYQAVDEREVPSDDTIVELATTLLRRLAETSRSLSTWYGQGDDQQSAMRTVVFSDNAVPDTSMISRELEYDSKFLDCWNEQPPEGSGQFNEVNMFFSGFDRMVITVWLAQTTPFDHAAIVDALVATFDPATVEVGKPGSPTLESDTVYTRTP